MPTARSEPGHLSTLVDRFGERGDASDPEPVESARSVADSPGSSPGWRSTDVFAELHRAAAGSKATADAAHGPAVPPGRRLGRYHLIGRIGSGSQGEVWRAVRASRD